MQLDNTYLQFEVKYYIFKVLLYCYSFANIILITQNKLFSFK